MASLKTPECTASYPSLFAARLRKNASPGDKPRFSLTCLFTAEAVKSAEYKSMQAAVIEAAKAAWGGKAESMLREGVVDLPFKKDIESAGFPAEYAAYIRCSASEENPPAVVSRSLKPITDKREIYPGCKVRVSLGVYAYGGPGTQYKPGVRFGLRNVQKIADGPRIDGRANAQDEFEAQPEEDGDLNSLTGQEAAGDMAGLLD